MTNLYFNAFLYIYIYIYIYRNYTIYLTFHLILSSINIIIILEVTGYVPENYQNVIKWNFIKEFLPFTRNVSNTSYFHLGSFLLLQGLESWNIRIRLLTKLEHRIGRYCTSVYMTKYFSTTTTMAMAASKTMAMTTFTSSHLETFSNFFWLSSSPFFFFPPLILWMLTITIYLLKCSHVSCP